MKNPKSPTDKKRFDKIIKHIAEKASPLANNMANQDEADAEDQEGKKQRLRNVDLPSTPFH
jgi:hypothetical protein